MPRENYLFIEADSDQIPSQMKNALYNFINDVNMAADKHLKDFVSKRFAIDSAIAILEDLLAKEYSDINGHKETSFNKTQSWESQILEITISDSDSEDNNTKSNASQKFLAVENSQPHSDEEMRLTQMEQRFRKRVFKFEPRSDSVSPQSNSDSDLSWEERPIPTQPKKPKIEGSDSDSEKKNYSLKDSLGKFGRKKIHPILRDDQLSARTKQVARTEKERLKRIAKRRKMYNEMYEIPYASESTIDQLVLDFGEESKEPLVSVNEGLVKRLKPHQAHVIKFMWDTCFESLKTITTTKGSGCILANCMDPDKSLQIVTLSHTLLTTTETGIKTVLVVCLHKDILIWVNKFKLLLHGIEGADKIKIYEMTQIRTNLKKQSKRLGLWQKTGGVMIISYTMFRNLTEPTAGKKELTNNHKTFLQCLVDPGPNLLICDNGRLLKNFTISEPMTFVKTRRRIVLTDTPLQNHLIEYYSMMQFIKPYLLGTRKEFTSRFVHPITNGQFDDSTDNDVKLMIQQTSILQKLLEGSTIFTID